MKKRVVPLMALSGAMLVLSACAANSSTGSNQTGSNQALVANSQIGSVNPNVGSEQSEITASQAGATAVEMVGGGSVQGLETTTANGGIQFVVQVDHDGNIYDVTLDAQSGDFISLRLVEQQAAAQMPSDDIAAIPVSLQGSLDVVPDYPAHQQAQPPQAPAQAGNITIPANITPRPPARQGGPANPAISAQRAVELARDHLVAIGVASARFDYLYMDMENGVWVWSVEFDGQGRSYEFYVDVSTGAFVQAPSGGGPPPGTPSPPGPGHQHGGMQSGRQSNHAMAATPQASPSPSPGHMHGGGQSGRPSNPAISLERAIEIGYAEIASRGHTGSFRSHSGMDWEPRYGGWVWEVLFSVQGGRLPLVEMYIHVDTGNVAKWEWDD